MSSRSNTSRLAIATAEATGWPANVEPWANISLPLMNGSATWSETIMPPIGTYADVIALATVMMSGTNPYRWQPNQ